jgi:hypothetical protein
LWDAAKPLIISLAKKEGKVLVKQSKDRFGSHVISGDATLGDDAAGASGTITTATSTTATNMRPLDGLVVVELGAGCGTVGLAAAALGAAVVVLTDKPACVPILVENIAANEEFGYNVRCLPLDWESLGTDADAVVEACGGRAPDLIIASDCLYSPDLLDPFAATLARLARASTPVGFGGGGGSGSSGFTVRPVQVILTFCRRGGVTTEEITASLARIPGFTEIGREVVPTGQPPIVDKGSDPSTCTILTGVVVPNPLGSGGASTIAPTPSNSGGGRASNIVLRSLGTRDTGTAGLTGIADSVGIGC